MANNRRSVADSGIDMIVDTAKKVHDGVISRADGYLEGTYDPKAHARKALIKGGTTAVIVLSILTGLAFSSPSEIIDDQASAQLNQPPIVMEIDDYANAEVDDEDDAEEEKQTKLGFMARFKQAVLSLPTSVRVLLITPLWALGTGLMTAVSFLWNVIFSSPLAAFLASFGIGFAVLLGLFLLTAKMLFPDIPIRKLLCKRNLLILVAVAIGLAGVDAIAPLFWHQYPVVAALLKITTGAGVIGILSLKTRELFHRDQYKDMPAAA